MSSRSTSNEKGAAEEPGPEQDGSLSSSSSSTTASYDPTVFQRPHPDDRGGADGKKGGGGKAKTKGKTKTKDGKGKSVGRCGNCDAEGAKIKCSQCGTEVYCDEKCQRVRGGRVSARGGGAMAAAPPRSHARRIVPVRPTQEHWKYGGRKKACMAYVLADTAHAQQQRLCVRRRSRQLSA